MIVSDRSAPGSGGCDKAGSSDRQNFLRRTASALVLAPLAIAAAFVGGWIFGMLGIMQGRGLIGSIIVAFIGAVILLWVIRLVKKA